MALDLSSVFAKTARSNEHLDELKERVRERLEPGDFTVSMELNAGATEHVWTFRAPRGTDFTEISLCVGDCVHNLRSALDHLVYSIAVHESGRNPPPDETVLAFPLTKTSAEFKKAKNRIRTLSINLQKVIEKVQPYNRTTRGLPCVLGALARFDDTDKHRLLKVVALLPRFNSTAVGWENVEGEGHQIKVNGEWAADGLKDGTEMCRMLFSSPQPRMYGTFNGTFFLGIRHELGPPTSGISEVVGLLTALIDDVQAVVKTVSEAVV
jgi:hypothetical protein